MSIKLHHLLKASGALFLFALATPTFAQQQDIPFDDLPPTNTYGKCYAKCKVADKYETVSVQQLVKEASTKLVKVPAVYETQTEQVMIKEGRTEYKTIPATFRTATESVVVEPARTVVKTIPAKYETRTRQVLVSEAHGEWVKKKKSPNCFSENPEDCYVVCFEEIPAVYRTEKYQVLGTAARTEERTVPAKTKTVTRKVIDRPARVEEKYIDPSYRTISKRVMISPESVREETIPASYKTVNEKRLVSQGGYTVWTEILCPSKTGSQQIRSVQRALNAKGYSCGTADGVMGVRTQTALKQFQTDMGLPIGNLNLDTLEKLGVN